MYFKNFIYIFIILSLLTGFFIYKSYNEFIIFTSLHIVMTILYIINKMRLKNKSLNPIEQALLKYILFLKFMFLGLLFYVCITIFQDLRTIEQITTSNKYLLFILLYIPLSLLILLFLPKQKEDLNR